MGRHSFQFTPEVLEDVEKLAGLGLSVERISGFLGIHFTTFHRHQADNPEIKLAIDKGRASASIKVAKSLFDKAISGDVGAGVWWEKTRDGKSDRMAHVIEPPPTPEDEKFELAELEAFLIERGIEP